MTEVRRFLRRLVTLIRFGKAESELSREIHAHLQLLEDQFVEKGMSRQDARHAARRAFGGVEQAKEHQRDARAFSWLAGWPMDLKLGARMLVKSPGLTIIAVVALAVAIGGGAAYAEFVQDLLHATLPVPGGDRIVGLQVWNAQKAAPERRPAAAFTVWRDGLTTVDHVGASARLESGLITGDGRSEPARGVEISAAAFRMIPARPVLGRTLVQDDERPSAPSVVVIGHELWQTRFHGDPDVLGRIVRLGAVAHTVAGVMPPDFGFPINQNLWTPLKVPAAGLRNGEGPELLMFGRLKDGVSIEAARAEAEAILRGADDAATVTNRTTADVRPFVDSLMSDRTTQALALYSANIFFLALLGICGANVATLVFARTATREEEITVRTALGASRRRIGAQLFAEALVLSSIAAVVGLAAASMALGWVTSTFFAAASGSVPPFWWDDRLSLETIVYTAALAVLAALIVGVIPALKATGPRLQGRLREAGGGSSMKFGRLWTGVVITQVAVTVVFLLSTVALGWIAWQNYGFDVTFDRTRFLSARLVGEEGAAAEARASAYRQIERTLMSDPRVVNVTYATGLPGSSQERFLLEFSETAVAADGKTIGNVWWTLSTRVGPNYFETFGIPLVAGRFFSPSEIGGGQNVAIVDETFVRQILGGRNAVGLMVRRPRNDADDAPGPWHEIVGVVKDVSVRSRKTAMDAVLYRPAVLGQSPLEYLVVHTRGDAAPVATVLRIAAAEADPNLRLIDVMSMDRLADADGLTMQFYLTAFSIVASVALLLSTAGIYSLISFTLARRTREIGIRTALGAPRRSVIGAVLSRAFVQIGIGVAAGSVPGAAIMELSNGGGLITIGAALGVSLFIILVAFIACLVPLRRALRIEPIQALRAAT